MRYVLLTALLMAACQSSADTKQDKDDPPASAPVTAVSVAKEAAPSSPSVTAQPEPAKAPGPLNVMLLTVDSLRSDMPWTDYPKEIAPNLTKLAKESTVYTRAYSVSSYTAKSVSAMLAGRYPSALYRSGWFFAGFSDANLFFTEVLQQKSIRTLGGHAHKYFERGKNLNQGFDEWQLTPGITFDSSTDKNVTSHKMTDMAIEMLKQPTNTGGQFFMWLHYMDPHDEYIKHKESPDFGKHNRDRYDSEVFYTDLHIGRLLDYAKKQAWWDNTVVMISADHGEAFGEHGMFKHAFELWDVLTHVPLVVYGPGIKAQKINERRSLIDLAPTIVDLMGAGPVPESFTGKTLVAELQGKEKADNREPIILDLPEDKNNPERHAILSGDYKLIVKGPGTSFQLYNLRTDPEEKKDLSKSEAAKLTELKELYKKTWNSVEVVAPFGGMKLRSGKTANGPRGPAEMKK